MHTIAMGVPRQPLVPDELKYGGIDGHAEGLPAELGAEAYIGLGLILDADVRAVWIPRRPEAGTAEPCPNSIKLNARHQEFVPDVDGGVFRQIFVWPDDSHGKPQVRRMNPTNSALYTELPDNACTKDITHN
jgi:hypothetical protein